MRNEKPAPTRTVYPSQFVTVEIKQPTGIKISMFPKRFPVTLPYCTSLHKAWKE